jgi:murein DD-endopeptidase MepM/ murein hydrolase activator NlpD
MNKGYSVIITSTDSVLSKHIFISRMWFKIMLGVGILLVVAAVIAAAYYSVVYYQALQSVMLRRRNAEIEQEFAKLQEIKDNLETAERNNRKLKVMLGIDKTPAPVQPYIDSILPDYTNTINMIVEKEENIPGLLPTLGQISRNYSPEHEGIDIAAPRFSPVVAAASGFIGDAGWDAVYGNYVVIEHDVNYSTFYGHLHSIGVRQGDKITSGTVLGTIGSTGRSTSPHLHYEVRFRGEPVDPMGYLQLLVTR